MPDAEALRVLREQFGHAAFRPGQERVIAEVLAGRDVVGVLPTGGGKSLTYQLAAQLLPGLTLVVSPLLALMKDQVDSLERSGVAAGSVSSAQSEGEAEGHLRRAVEGETKLLYVTPERLDDDGFMASLGGAEVSLLVVDEAHCVSEWGHDFRPAYLRIAEGARRLGRPRMLALTATAGPWLRAEIAERLGMRDPRVVARGADRPGLFLEAVRVEAEAEDRRVLQALLTEPPAAYPPDLAAALRGAMDGPGIVYTATVRGAVETARWLGEWGVAADYYHGRRAKKERTRVQDAFMAGDLRVIAATNAFGLGVDKPDVRFVVHRDVPGSVEAYYQEAGRAGRDGALARCTLIYRVGDLGRAAFLNGTADPRRREFERGRAEMVRGYAETRECRRAYLLNYFGEEYDPAECDMCDNHRRGLAADAAPAGRFAMNQRVVHAAWGGGVVQRVADDAVTVLFDEVGYKTLATDLVERRALLRPVD